MRAERPQRELGIVRVATALTDHGVVIDPSENLRERSARALGYHDASFETQLGLWRFEDPGGRAEQLLLRVPCRDAYRGPHRRSRKRSRRDRPVGVVAVTQPDLRIGQLAAELIRASLRQARAHPGPTA